MRLGVLASSSQAQTGAILFDAWPGTLSGNATQAMLSPFSTGGSGGTVPIRDAAGVLVPDRLQFETTDPPPGRLCSLRMECRQFDTELYYNSFSVRERVQASTWAAPVTLLPKGAEYWAAMWFKFDTFTVPRATANLAVTGITGTAVDDTFHKTAHGLVDGERLTLSALTGGTGLLIGGANPYFVSNAVAGTFKLVGPPEDGSVPVTFTTDISAVTATTFALSSIHFQFWNELSVHPAAVCLNYHANLSGASGGFFMEGRNAGSPVYAYLGAPIVLGDWYAVLFHLILDDGTNGDGVVTAWARHVDDSFPASPQLSSAGPNVDPTEPGLYPTLPIYRTSTPHDEVAHCGGVRIATTRALAESLWA